MTEWVKKTAKVKSAFLGIEDHGILSMNLDFDFGSGGQGTGHYNLQNANGGPLIKAILETFAVDEWKQIPGHVVNVLYDTDDYDARVKGFEQLPFDGGRRLIFSEFLEAHK